MARNTTRPTLAALKAHGSCGHCRNGYRTDFYSADHGGARDAASTECEAALRPCLEHECYRLAADRASR